MWLAARQGTGAIRNRAPKKQQNAWQCGRVRLDERDEPSQPKLSLTRIMADPRIYLDHAATTPVLAEARAAMAAGLESWANPSSPHADGRAARAALEAARARIAEALGWDGEVILTSGASEAIALAMQASKTDGWIVSPTEHDAVQRIADRAPDTRTVLRLAVDLDGRLVLASLQRALDAGAKRPLVIVQSVNSETGVMQDVEAVTAMAREARAPVLCDCSQSAGKIPLPDADMIVISAHKLGGPPGIGALLVRDPGVLNPSGGQEKGYRSGTENVPAALGFAAALSVSRNWIDRAADLRHQLESAIRGAGGEVVAEGAQRLPTIGSYRMPGVQANAQLIQFDLAGVAVSAGSACSSGTLKTSAVLTAMGWDEKAAGEVVRVSFGPSTTRAHVYRFIELWRAMAERVRS
jgi:cysteine desulfurase